MDKITIQNVSKNNIDTVNQHWGDYTVCDNKIISIGDNGVNSIDGNMNLG